MTRFFLLTLSLILGLAPAAIWAQQPTQAVLMEVLVPSIGPSDPLIDAIRDGLRQQGI